MKPNAPPPGTNPRTAIRKEGEIVKERVLKRLTLQQAIEIFASRKWNFFEVKANEKIIRLEAPVGSGETYIVELPYRDPDDLHQIRPAVGGLSHIDAEPVQALSEPP
jgi:hypothetical protein